MLITTALLDNLLTYRDDLGSAYARRNKMRDIALAEMSRDGFVGLPNDWSNEIRERVSQMQYALSCRVAGWL